MKNEIHSFGLKFHPWSMNYTLDFIENNIVNNRHSLQHMVVNVAKLVNSQKDEQLRKAINNSNIVNIDGLPIAWVLRFFGFNIPERVAGIDLFQNLIKLSADKGYRPFFLGAKPEIVEELVEVFHRQYSDLEIAGYHHGYFTEDDKNDIATNIKNSKPDMLFLGITSPKKELFLDKYTNYMNIPFSMGVGGSFDIIAGKIKRAPIWMQKTGVEWFFRILQEPKRMWKRYLVTNTLFIYYIIKELIKKKLL